MRTTTDKQRSERTARLERRIARERAQFALRPWQFAPSEVNDGPCPWSAGSAGFASWQQAQRWRAELIAENSNYFDD